MTAQPLHARRAVITGASAGIGESVARACAAAGAACVLNARRAPRLEALARELAPAPCRTAPGDCADDAVIAAMLDAARDVALPPREADLVIVNAGRGLNGSVVTSDPAQWEELLRTNILGAGRLIRAAAQRMLREIGERSGPGVLDRPRDIVVIGSVVGRHVSPFSSMYGGTKFAVHAMAEGVRREVAAKGIRVTLIEPGFVVSEFQGVAGYDPAWVQGVFDKIGPPLTPDDVARAVLFAASQPPGVHVSDILIRPTRQDYP
ncbi:MAG: SDR family NAD(P)-dependent oxidoreductase [Planctomycetota bacterium]|nr:SDR family NAD(P)-dependent oxidoreductase [Planctomycetota bacterium]